MSIEDLLGIITLLQQHKWLAVAALVIGLLVRLSKQDVPGLPTVPARYRPMLALCLGAASGLLQRLSDGEAGPEALVGGLVSAALALGGHAVVVDFARGGRDIGTPKPKAPKDGPPTPKSPPRDEFKSDPNEIKASNRRESLSSLDAIWIGTLMFIAAAFLWAGCTPQQARAGHVLVDVGEAACVVAVQAIAPGFEVLCGLADDAIDALIDAETKTMMARGSMRAPPADAKLLQAALAVKQARAKAVKK